MTEMVTIPKKEYEELKKKAGESIEEELNETIEDLSNGRVCEAKDLEDI